MTYTNVTKILNGDKELTEKYELLPEKNIRWHLIGTLQTNKVKYIIDKVYLIHSVDTLRLIDEINRQAGKKGIKANILLQRNRVFVLLLLFLYDSFVLIPYLLMDTFQRP